MQIIVDPKLGTVNVDGVSRVVVFPTEYSVLDTTTYDSNYAAGISDMVGSFTTASIIGLSLALWHAAAPNAEEMWTLIKEKRSQMNAGGVFAAGDWYHTDSESLAQYSIMYAAIPVNSLPDSYVFNTRWKTMDGAFRPMTVKLLKNLINTGMVTAGKNFLNAELHKAAMMNTRVPSSYDYSTGWELVHI